MVAGRSRLLDSLNYMRDRMLLEESFGMIRKLESRLRTNKITNSDEKFVSTYLKNSNKGITTILYKLVCEGCNKDT